MPVETQASIAQWATETFGPTTAMDRILVHAMKEAAELLDAVTKPLSAVEIALEAADTTLILCRAGELCERDIITPFLTGVHQPGNPVVTAGRVASLLATAFEFVTAWDADSLVTKRPTDWVGNARMHGYITLTMHALGRCAAGATGRAEALGQFVDIKVRRNRESEFTRDGTGHGYRVKTPTP